jgi:hypothetical protein
MKATAATAAVRAVMMARTTAPVTLAAASVMVTAKVGMMVMVATVVVTVALVAGQRR